jgi:hypothetical protein
MTNNITIKQLLQSVLNEKDATTVNTNVQNILSYHYIRYDDMLDCVQNAIAFALNKRKPKIYAGYLFMLIKDYYNMFLRHKHVIKMVSLEQVNEDYDRMTEHFEYL